MENWFEYLQLGEIATFDQGQFHFIRRHYLWGLAACVAIFALLIRNKARQGDWSKVCDKQLLPLLLASNDGNYSNWRLYLGLALGTIAVLAAAGPTWQRLPVPVFRNDAALVIGLDLSRSMNAQDIRPSRLTLARYKIVDILKQRKDGQSALLVYAGAAFTVTPLTQDNATIVSQMEALQTKIMPALGNRTDIAIRHAVQLLKQAGLQGGDILLLSDEVDFAGSIDSVRKLGDYRLSILGVGTSGGAPIKNRGGGFVKSGNGKVALAKLNEDKMRELAAAGGGIYRRISLDNSDIEALLEQFSVAIDSGEDQAKNTQFGDLWLDFGVWLSLALLPFATMYFRKGVL